MMFGPKELDLRNTYNQMYNKINNKDCKVMITVFLIIITLYFVGYPIPCLFHKITGLYCPGCGTTRMIICILKFDFYNAFRNNQVCFIYLVISLIYLILRALFNIKLSKKSINYICVIAIIILIIFGILRNLPYFPFLRPID